MVQVDHFTRYPEVGVLYSLTARAVIPTLWCIFARGMNSQDAVTPLWPEANGDAYIFVKTIKKPIKTAKMKIKDWQYEMSVFLRNYRAKLHASSTRVPPQHSSI